MKNFYEGLQVFPNASAQEIKDAFRFLLFRYHPDHNKGREEWAVQQTMELVEAYHILSDPVHRAHYDLLRTVRIREDTGKKNFSLFGKGRKVKQAETIFHQAVGSYKEGELEQAVQHFRKVRELYSECPNLGYNLAVVFLGMERLPECSNILQEYVDGHRDDADARALLVKVIALAHKKDAG